MPVRQNYYVEEDTRTTTASTTFQDKITLTFTPDDNATYWFIWAANLDNNDTNDPAELRFRDDTAATNLALIRTDGATADREFCWGGVYAKTYGASPGSQSFKLQYRHELGGASIAGCFNARIIAVKATANDQSAASDGDTITTSATLSDKTTLTFTPGTTGDYLVIATCDRLVNSTTDEFRHLLDIDGTQYCDGEDPVLNSTDGEIFGYMAMKKVNLDATSHTIKLQHSSPSGVSTVTTRNARILALRLDDFLSNNSAEQFTRQTVTGTTAYTTALSNTFTAVTANYLTLACGIIDHSNFGAGRACFQQLLDNTAAQIGYAQSFPRQTPVGNNGRLPVFFAKRQSLTAGVLTYLLQHHPENAADNAGFDEMTLISIQLTENTGSLEPVGQIVM